jgi:hypothetical protein
LITLELGNYRRTKAKGVLGGVKMLRQFLENKIGQPISNKEFKEIKHMIHDDIKFNFVDFGKIPYINDILLIAERCAVTLKRCS